MKVFGAAFITFVRMRDRRPNGKLARGVLRPGIISLPVHRV
jgi:hypothetical protein